MKFILLPHILLSFTLVLPAIAAGDPATLEQGFFESYDELYQAAEVFESELNAIQPTEGFTYSEADLKEYHSMLEALYEKKPEYKSLTLREVDNDPTMKKVAKAVGVSRKELGVYEAAETLAAMTGLPHRELAVYQKGKGVFGLRKLLYSVENLQHFQWVAWYLTLRDIGDSKATAALFLNDGADQPGAATLRESYVQKQEKFKQAYQVLLDADHAAQQESIESTTRNQLAVKAYLYQYISKKAGHVGWLSENRAGYPFSDATPAKYPKAASLADKLGVEFTDLAYVKKKEGNYGLEKLLKTMTWLPELDALIEEAKQ